MLFRGRGGNGLAAANICAEIYICMLHTHTHTRIHRLENQHFAQRESAIEREREKERGREKVFERGERFNKKVVALSHILSLSFFLIFLILFVQNHSKVVSNRY